MKLSKPLLAVLLAAGAAAAHAEGLYAGASLGAPFWNSTVDGVDGNGRGVAGKLYGGYGFSPNFALEAGAMHLGESRDISGKVKADGAYLDAVGTLPLSKDWSLLGRIGAAHARFNGPGGDSSDTGLKLGAGAQYQLSSTMALRAEYEQYRFHDVFDAKANVGQVTGGLVVNF
ncbi:outer membrane beta-barrel protein [Piscinibacter sp. XHJ-5]|uniref:outer membrane beta-barrel protein n=1 Tax=Piscinibacter sp. XHJ-5 TaxID=3037797 RepID=UPI002453449D|nr:outer membrane beta-barrel protein [Piscinibacter sp. XHJ-5]